MLSQLKIFFSTLLIILMTFNIVLLAQTMPPSLEESVKEPIRYVGEKQTDQNEGHAKDGCRCWCPSGVFQKVLDAQDNSPVNHDAKQPDEGAILPTGFVRWRPKNKTCCHQIGENQSAKDECGD